jgi:hypothetical protein
MAYGQGIIIEASAEGVKALGSGRAPAVSAGYLTSRLGRPGIGQLGW